MNTTARFNSETTISGIEEWLKVIWCNEKKFEKRFCPEAWLIEEVWWSTIAMKINYIQEDGSTITNNFPIEDWLEFYDKNK